MQLTVRSCWDQTGHCVICHASMLDKGSYRFNRVRENMAFDEALLPVRCIAKELVIIEQ